MSEDPVINFIDPVDIEPIIDELKRQKLPVNNYRNKSGSGRSQAFGIVCRRCLPPDYSRLCWQRPYLYKLLLDFGKKYVSIPFTSITVNQNYKASKHRDKGNTGQSYLVAFGNFTGGELEIHEGPLTGIHDVRSPLITDFSKVEHSVRPFTGDRYSLVFYVAKKSEGLPVPSIEQHHGKWVFKRGDEIIEGLPHPLKGRKKIPMTKVEGPVSVDFV